MTAQRRTRRRSPRPDQQDRLRALTTGAAPAAREPRARSPRPPGQPGEGSPPIPSAPYAVPGADSPYRPHPPDASGGGPRPGTRDARSRPAEGTDPHPAPAAPGSAEEAVGAGDGPATGARRDGTGRTRPSPPPPGYTEFTAEPPQALLERLARRWPPHAALSRRAVIALVVLGALAVVAVLALHHRPTAVTAPEMVPQAAPADHPAPEEGAAPRPAAADAPATGAEGAELVVHVGGEVRDPGLYTLEPGSRVADAVEEAGGPLEGADLDLLNLARPLVDGEQLLVGVPAASSAPGPDPAGVGGPVNLNQADRALLETLPGVGPVIADNIISHREQHGPFSSVDELLNVTRIGEKMLATLRPHVTVG
ncbi:MULTISPECIES: helix-hairpin-helix domain-containing protein [unclassified Nocardiopsis]|uniref:helix-hairpin-helix domain-containing protein n=1 Tax=unclassified Nocardiopsis TaxID=2649073 RepID=UPI00135B4A15|nr:MULTISPECIES: helix-hairpin-helix domain-containing protein [unclassified Nocardiopsis]